jgi:hypothetical protein
MPMAFVPRWVITSVAPSGLKPTWAGSVSPASSRIEPASGWIFAPLSRKPARDGSPVLST